jgi:DNA-binding SARP family transcriptional activator
VEFRVLGTFEAVRDGSKVLLGSAYKSRLVLAALLSRADHAVTADWLIGAVWPDQPPMSARQNLHGYIHRLRAMVGGDLIVSRADT